MKSSRGFSAGLGVGPAWNGFFTKHFDAGRIDIDVSTATVVEHRLYDGPLGDESIETFGDYIPLEGGYAPKSLRIQTDSFDMRLWFEIHEGGLWMLDEASHGEDEPVLRIENVVVESAE